MILAAAVLFSTGGAAIKGCTMTGWQVACLRSGLAAIVLAALLPSSRRGWTVRTLAVGAAYAATMILFVLANKLTTAANTIFLQSTAPLHVLLLGPWLLSEPIRGRDLGLMVVIGGGLALFFVGGEAAQASAPDPATGNLLATAAGLSWALTLIGLRWLERSSAGDGGGPSGLSAVVAGNGIAALVAIPWALPIGGIGPADGAILVYLGAIQIGLAYVLLTRGFRKVGAFEASLLILLEPTLNPVWAWLVQGEVPGPLALTGGAILLAATAGKAWLDRYPPGG